MNELMIPERKEVAKLSLTIRELMPGGNRLTVIEAQTLAQVALMHGLDPFNGEVWYLKYEDGRSIGIMAGIKGHRRAAHRQLDPQGGNFWCEFDQLTPDEKKAMAMPDNAIAFRCRLFDSISLRLYTETIERLCKAGAPWADVKGMAGERPFSVGYGFFASGEKSKMKPHACAMKRAEADALKRRFDLPFGSAVGVNGDADVAEGDFAASSPEQDPAEIQARMQTASKSLRGDQSDIELGPTWPPIEYPTNTATAKTMTDRPEVVPEPGHEPPIPEPPEPPAQPAPAKSANEPITKRASISAAIRKPFVDWCSEWVTKDARAAQYADEHGHQNMYHILGRIGKLGFSEVTAENVEAVKVKLQEHIEKENK